MSERLQLKRATELLVKSVGGIEAAAGILDRGHSTVGRWTNRNDADYSIPLAELAELEANAPAPLVTKALCRLAHGVFVPLPRAPGCDQALPQTVMEVAAEVGDVSHKIAEGLADDGALDERETEAALAEVEELEAKVAQLRLLLERRRAETQMSGGRR